MRVLLKAALEHLGRPGELVVVKPGFARNFLVPRGLAMEVTRDNQRTVEMEMKRQKGREEKRRAQLQDMARRISEANCTVAAKADESDKLYGSVTPAEIVKALKLVGLDVDPKAVHLDDPIKAVGVFTVKVVLDTGVSADLKVWVVKE